MAKSVVAIIMAGGLGKRMNSDIPKVLHNIMGIPMIIHLLCSLQNLASDNDIYLEKTIVVVGKYKEQIKDTIGEKFQMLNVIYVTQEVAQGTGHAIQCCKDELLYHLESDVLILSGDVPFLSMYTMKNLLYKKSDVKIITTTLEDPTGYGRIILEDEKFDKIVEQKDCCDIQLNVKRVNGGIYAIKSNLLCKYLSYLKNDNNQGEYYLTDVIEIIKREEDMNVDMLEIEKEKIYEIIGVNNLKQLGELEKMIYNV
jgi:UDP-N-acetylglucosamine diphosphorylase/glucosamine-1-phosphate N-acetyltransferase